MSIEKNLGLGLASALGALVAVGVACSSGSTNVVGTPIKCGAGTTLSGDSCVAEQPDGSMTVADGGGMADAGPTDSSPPIQDSSVTDSADATPLVSDPCPATPPLVNCDRSCDQGQHADGGYLCSETTCEYDPNDPQGSDDPFIKPIATPAVLRTPDMPPDMWGADATGSIPCSIACSGLPDAEIAHIEYGIGFQIPEVTEGNLVQVTVGAPWYIDLVTENDVRAFCPYVPPRTYRAQGCNSSLHAPGPPVFVVWTDDPNAVARNIEVTEVPVGTECQ